MCDYVIVDKDRELSEAQAEIKSLRLSERLREKAVEEVLLSSYNVTWCGSIIICRISVMLI